MRFSILIPQTIEIPAQKVSELMERVRRDYELPDGEAVAVEDILQAAFADGFPVPEKFNVDDAEEVQVTNEELAEAIEDESDES